MTRVAIIGAGDLGAQLAHHAGSIRDMEIAGFFDDFRTPGALVSGKPVFGAIADIAGCYAGGNFDQLLIGVGYKHLDFRNQLYARFHETIPFAKLIHPQAWLDPTCEVGAGAVIYPGCIVDMHARIGANTLLNVGCVVAHHSVIGPGCFLSPAVKIAGFAHVLGDSVLGIGTIVIDNVSICPGVRTGAGAVVIDNIVEPGLYIGVPAKLNKRDWRSE